MFDHLLSQRPIQNATFQCLNCYMIANIITGDIATCKLISAHGANSKRLSLVPYEYNDDDDIPILNKSCKHPIYMYGS